MKDYSLICPTYDHFPTENKDRQDILSDLVCQVGLWSKYNFGKQESKLRKGTELNEIAPMLGIIEELGEYKVAQYNYDNSAIDDQRIKFKAEAKDAICDALIFLCDFSYRITIPLKLGEKQIVIHHPYDTAVKQYRELCHLILKSHQGIRGMDIPLVRKDLIKRCTTILLRSLVALAINNSFDLIPYTIIEVWNKEVCKRDWKNK